MLSLEEVRTRLEVVNIMKLSERIEIHHNTLYRIVNGGSCNATTLKKISDYFEGK